MEQLMKWDLTGETEVLGENLSPTCDTTCSMTPTLHNILPPNVMGYVTCTSYTK
jgi:hypothetical protein